LDAEYRLFLDAGHKIAKASYVCWEYGLLINATILFSVLRLSLCSGKVEAYCVSKMDKHKRSERDLPHLLDSDGKLDEAFSRSGLGLLT